MVVPSLKIQVSFRTKIYPMTPPPDVLSSKLRKFCICNFFLKDRRIACHTGILTILLIPTAMMPGPPRQPRNAQPAPLVGGPLLILQRCTKLDNLRTLIIEPFHTKTNRMILTKRFTVVLPHSVIINV